MGQWDKPEDPHQEPFFDNGTDNGTNNGTPPKQWDTWLFLHEIFTDKVRIPPLTFPWFCYTI